MPARPYPGGPQERADLLALLLGALLIPALWVALGWRPDHLVGGNDLSLLLLPTYQRLLDARGAWESFLYDPTWVGGTKLRDLSGELPLWGALARLGTPPVLALNLCAFFAQLLLGALGLASYEAAADLFEAPRAAPRLVSRLAVLVLCAFAPVAAWRIAYGHLFILFGALALPAAVTLYLLWRTRRLTLTMAGAALVALAHAFPHVAQQPVLYGAVFGAPLCLGLIATPGRGGRSWRPVAAALVPVLACACLALPTLVPISRYYRSDDSGRGFQRSEPVTYSNVVASGEDLLFSLPWAYQPTLSSRPSEAHHETNYPLGPLLPLAALLLLARRRAALPLLAGLGASALLVVAFSGRAPALISDALLGAIPPLRLFRVPGRAWLALLLAATPLLLAALPLRYGRGAAPTRGGDAGVALLGVLALLAPPLQGELLVLLGVLGGLWLSNRGDARWVPSLPALLLLLALGAVQCFQQRLMPFPSAASVYDLPRRVGAQAKAARPELRAPLQRAYLVGPAQRLLNPNDAYLGGVATLDGYILLGERFLRLLYAVAGLPYAPGITALRLEARDPRFRPLVSLYNLGPALGVQDGQAQVKAGYGARPPLWTSAALTPVASYDALAAELHQADPARGGSEEALRARLLVLSSDAASRGLPAPGPGCAALTPEHLEISRGPTLLRARLAAVPEGPGCLLTVSMNYTEDLEAFAQAPSGERVPLRLFPAYGALLGVHLPGGVRAFEVRLLPRRPPWTLALAGLGALALLLWLGAALSGPRSRRQALLAPLDR